MAHLTGTPGLASSACSIWKMLGMLGPARHTLARGDPGTLGVQAFMLLNMSYTCRQAEDIKIL